MGAPANPGAARRHQADMLIPTAATLFSRASGLVLWPVADGRAIEARISGVYAHWMKIPTDAEVDAAARQLFKEGSLHHWWPSSFPNYDGMDPIGKDEFDAIVERVLVAAAKARSEA
jgi:hypothetical protein